MPSRAVDRRIGVAGGKGKTDAIRGALLGGWSNILVTDLESARRLIERAPSGRAASSA